MSPAEPDCSTEQTADLSPKQIPGSQATSQVVQPRAAIGEGLASSLLAEHRNEKLDQILEHLRKMKRHTTMPRNLAPCEVLMGVENFVQWEFLVHLRAKMEDLEYLLAPANPSTCPLNPGQLDDCNCYRCNPMDRCGPSTRLGGWLLAQTSPIIMNAHATLLDETASTIFSELRRHYSPSHHPDIRQTLVQISLDKIKLVEIPTTEECADTYARSITNMIQVVDMQQRTLIALGALAEASDKAIANAIKSNLSPDQLRGHIALGEATWSSIKMYFRKTAIQAKAKEIARLAAGTSCPKRKQYPPQMAELQSKKPKSQKLTCHLCRYKWERPISAYSSHSTENCTWRPSKPPASTQQGKPTKKVSVKGISANWLNL